jgi:hypothetical protein
MYYIRVAHSCDAALIGPLLREADKSEIAANSGLHPEEALRQSLDTSSEVHLACHPDGTPLSIFGIGPNTSEPSIGIPWMVGTDEMSKYNIPLVRDARKWVDRHLNTYSILTNYVDSRNTVHLKWLRHIGFNIDETPQFVGVDLSVPFYQFIRRK